MKNSLTTLNIGLCILVIGMLGFGSAEATVSKKGPARTYSAMEQEEPAQPAETVPTAPAPKLAPRLLQAPQQITTSPSSAVIMRPTAKSNDSYDPVPSDQVNPVIRRLRLVEEIVRKHQRAYDYRMLTTRDLELILAKLETKPQPQTQAQSQTTAPDLEPESAEEAPENSEQ